MSLLSGAHPQLLGYLLTILGQHDDAEDVLQQASVIMWEKFDTFEPGSDFLHWASRIAFYEARNFQRVTSHSRLQFDDELLATFSEERLEDLTYKSQRLAALDHCLQHLSEANGKLLNAIYADRSNISKLAAQLNRSPQTLYNKLHSLRRALLECVERVLHEDARD